MIEEGTRSGLPAEKLRKEKHQRYPSGGSLHGDHRKEPRNKPTKKKGSDGDDDEGAGRAPLSTGGKYIYPRHTPPLDEDGDPEDAE